MEEETVASEHCSTAADEQNGTAEIAAAPAFHSCTDLGSTTERDESPTGGHHRMNGYSNLRKNGKTQTPTPCKVAEPNRCKQNGYFPTEKDTIVNKINEFEANANNSHTSQQNGLTTEPGEEHSTYRLTDGKTGQDDLHLIQQKRNKQHELTDSELQNGQASHTDLPTSKNCMTKIISSLKGAIATPLRKCLVGNKSDDDKCMNSSAPLPSKREYIMMLYSIFVTLPLFISSGNTNTFSSPLLEDISRMMNATGPSDILNNESCAYQNLIGPCAMMGGILGASLTFTGWKIVGSVNTIIGTALVSILGWVMIGTSSFLLSHPSSPQLFWSLLLLGRAVTGLCMGLTCPILAVYYGGIACNEKHRTIFIVLQYTVYAFGVIETYILGFYLPYWICAFIYAGQQALALPFLFFIIRTQQEQKGTVWSRVVELKASLCMAVSDVLSSSKTQLYQISARLGSIQVLMLAHVYMGYSIMLMYIGPILQVAGADHWSVPHGVLIALTVGGSDLVGSIASAWVSTRIGRVLSCVLGAVGVSIGHLGLTVYFLLVEGLGPQDGSYHHNTTGGGWVNSSTHHVCFFEPTLNPDLGEQYSPLAMLSIAVFMLSFGVFWMSQIYMVMVELLPDQWRAFGTGLSITIMYINYSICSSVFPIFEREIGIAACFLILATISGLTAITLPAVLPETKGHPMGERGGEFTPRRNLTEFIQYFKSFLPGAITCSKTRVMCKHCHHYDADEIAT